MRINYDVAVKTFRKFPDEEPVDSSGSLMKFDFVKYSLTAMSI